MFQIINIYFNRLKREPVDVIHRVKSVNYQKKNIKTKKWQKVQKCDQNSMENDNNEKNSNRKKAKSCDHIPYRVPEDDTDDPKWTRNRQMIYRGDRVAAYHSFLWEAYTWVFNTWCKTS